MIRLSAFADEISADPDEQIAALLAEGIRHIDLRGAWGTNVLELSDEQVAELQERWDRAGIAIAAIASPIGKTPIDWPFEREEARLERAIELARRLGAPVIRVFSFYGPAGWHSGWQEEMRDEVLNRMRAMATSAERAGLLLVHENEREIYGDTVERCADLLSSVGSPALVAAFDPANYIQCGETPYPNGFRMLAPWIGYLHVKDARSDGTVTPAGEGEARFPELLAALRAQGYDGVMALEPHLAAQGRMSGFSGPELFGTAARALKSLLHHIGWAYE